MELSTFDVKTASESGAELHLKHPALGHLMYTGEGANDDGTIADLTKPHDKVCVLVRGTESKTVRDKARKVAQDRMTSPVASAKSKNNSPDHVPTAQEIQAQVAETEEAGLAFACSLVIEFKGITKDGKPLEATEANKREFFGQSDDLVAQVIKFAGETANFFKRGSKD